jgi:hypothetical protein
VEDRRLSARYARFVVCDPSSVVACLLITDDRRQRPRQRPLFLLSSVFYSESNITLTSFTFNYTLSKVCLLLDFWHLS